MRQWWFTAIFIPCLVLVVGININVEMTARLGHHPDLDWVESNVPAFVKWSYFIITVPGRLMAIWNDPNIDTYHNKWYQEKVVNRRKK